MHANTVAIALRRQRLEAAERECNAREAALVARSASLDGLESLLKTRAAEQRETIARLDQAWAEVDDRNRFSPVGS